MTDKLIERKESPLVKKLREAAAQRDLELNPQVPEQTEEITISDEESDDENQFSILDITPENDEESEEGEALENEASAEENTTNIYTEENQE